MSNLTNSTTGLDTEICYLLDTSGDRATWTELGDCCEDYGLVPKPLWVLMMACLSTLLLDVFISFLYWYMQKDLYPFFMVTETSPLVFHYVNIKILVQFVLTSIRWAEDDKNLDVAFSQRYFGYYFLITNGGTIVQALVLLLKAFLVNSTRWELLQHWAKDLQQKEKHIKRFRDKQVVQAIKVELLKDEVGDEISNLFDEANSLDIIELKQDLDIETLELELRYADVVSGVLLPLYRNVSDQWKSLLEEFPQKAAQDAIGEYFKDCLKKCRFSKVVMLKSTLFNPSSFNCFQILMSVFYEWWPEAYIHAFRLETQRSLIPVLSEVLVGGVDVMRLSSDQERFHRKIYESFSKSPLFKIDLDYELDKGKKVSKELEKILENDRFTLWLLHRMGRKLAQFGSASRFTRWLDIRSLQNAKAKMSTKTRKTSTIADRKPSASTDQRNSHASDRSNEKEEKKNLLDENDEEVKVIFKKWEAAIQKDDDECLKVLGPSGDIRNWLKMSKHMGMIKLKQERFLSLDKGIPTPALNSVFIKYFLIALLLVCAPYLISHALPSLFLLVLWPVFLIAFVYKRIIKKYIYHGEADSGDESRAISHVSGASASSAGNIQSRVGYPSMTTQRTRKRKKSVVWSELESAEHTATEQLIDDRFVKNAFDITKSVELSIDDLGELDEELRESGIDRQQLFKQMALARYQERKENAEQQQKGQLAPAPIKGENRFSVKIPQNRFSVKIPQEQLILAGLKSMTSFTNWAGGASMDIARDMNTFTREVCFSIMVISAAVFIVAMIYFILIHGSVWFNLIAYEKLSLEDATYVVLGYYSTDNFILCSLQAFENNDVAGIFEFFALF